ncbi:MAG: zinc-dependent peptidase [Hydrogenophaga sp.]|uniref:M90 family metallopeptidase n=1 Tax=Hydrogenophaga sp. TaxID=1904254 RepID=UPI00260CD199|nr:M90 family metallopeptidase [Hydrogenophaga sp.]MDM7942466.1 zinc-dependent peptidase [Hydrogenophaga sp.]
MIDLLQRLLPRSLRQPRPVPDTLWQTTLASHPFLSVLASAEQDRLRLLSTHFLVEKEFFGANGLELTDAMALAIAAQACLPLLHMHGPSGEAVRDPLKLLDWYGDFVGIVVQPGAVVAKRKTTDAAGVVHHFDEVLAGEAMDRGPLMLSWEEVAHASLAAETGSNVVIHEFVHKMDMRGISLGEHPDGAPPLPKGFLGTHSAAEARSLWRRTMQQAYDQFREAVTLAERFGGERPWLDDYAAKDPAEFFAVTCEAYFVSRERFAQEFPALVPLFDGFFRPATAAP